MGCIGSSITGQVTVEASDTDQAAGIKDTSSSPLSLAGGNLELFDSSFASKAKNMTWGNGTLTLDSGSP